MKKIIMILLCFNLAVLSAQGINGLKFKGTATAYGTYSAGFVSGAQFIPQLSGDFLPDTSSYIADFELSANTFLNYDTSDGFDWDVLPYRAWTRFAGNQFELRVGLQKITFGKAQLLRALSWFDTIDPRDPLGLTQGVVAERFRYYIPNSNANIWLWAIQEDLNDNSFYMPYAKSTFSLVNQLGARVELPVFQGEIGLSYNYKPFTSDSLSMSDPFGSGTSLGLNAFSVTRHQFGFDGKWDSDIGAWFELSLAKEYSDSKYLTQDIYLETETASLTLGLDYTIPLGNGLLLMAEYMGNMVRVDMELGLGESAAVEFYNLAGLMLSYPLGIFNSVGLMTFMDLDNVNYYAYVFWQTQFDNLTLRLSGALTNFDANATIFPGQSSSMSLGNMLQLMAIYDFKINLGRKM